MLEQIVNWFNNLNSFQLSGIVVLFTTLATSLCIYFQDIKPYLKNKQKTTTQKFKEGLIKK